MQLKVNTLALKNVGQTIAFDYDPNGEGASDPDLVQVMGILEGVKRGRDEIVLVVAGEEFPMTGDDTVEMVRSAVLSRLHYIEATYMRQEPEVATPYFAQRRTPTPVPVAV